MMMEEEDEEEAGGGERRVMVQLKSETGDLLGGLFDLPLGISAVQLQKLCDRLLPLQQQQQNKDEEGYGGGEAVPCAFYTAASRRIETNLLEALLTDANKTGGGGIDDLNTENVVEVVYQPQAIFRVAPVTRCSSSLPGHGEPVISVQFSPDGRYLASGSGDSTVRLWDLDTELPQFTCTGHKHWILAISWSPDGRKLASGCKNGQIRLWNPETGEQIGKPLIGHRKWITWLSWQPLHFDADCRIRLTLTIRKLASSSKDGDVRIWDTVLCSTVGVLSGHTSCVSCVRWGAEGLVYSSSQDRTIKVWRPSDLALCRTLQGHGHWVNTMALSTDYVLRTGGFEPQNVVTEVVHKGRSSAELFAAAKQRYERLKESHGAEGERLVSGSDDFTMFLWRPSVEKKPIGRMTGHQQLINQVMFSPDGRTIASASFDKSVKLWCGKSGAYLASLRGHVRPVYQLSWSADSRLLVTASADSTLKVWNVRTRALSIDLPGHGDEVFAVDWSPDGRKVASGGKDKLLKLWRR